MPLLEAVEQNVAPGQKGTCYSLCIAPLPPLPDSLICLSTPATVPNYSSSVCPSQGWGLVIEAPQELPSRFYMSEEKPKNAEASWG